MVDLACELRQRVHNQITEIAPGEFKPRLIGRARHDRARRPRTCACRSKDVLPQDDRLNREAVVGAVDRAGGDRRTTASAWAAT